MLYLLFDLCVNLSYKECSKFCLEWHFLRSSFCFIPWKIYVSVWVFLLTRQVVTYLAKNCKTTNVSQFCMEIELSSSLFSNAINVLKESWLERWMFFISLLAVNTNPFIWLYDNPKLLLRICPKEYSNTAGSLLLAIMWKNYSYQNIDGKAWIPVSRVGKSQINYMFICDWVWFNRLASEAATGSVL